MYIMANSSNNIIYSAVLFACSAKLWLVLANKNSKYKNEHILYTDDVDSNLQMMMNTSCEQHMMEDSNATGIMSLSNDITFHLASYLDTQDMLHLALTCKRFGAKDKNDKFGVNIMSLQGEPYFHSHSLMEEAAMRQLSQNITLQQMKTIPRSKGDTWLHLLSNPPKIQHWRLLNDHQATGSKSDRAFMMKAMEEGDLRMAYMTPNCCPADIMDTLLHLFQNESLIVLSMERPSPRDSDWGMSSGYCWEFTRSKLEKAKVFKSLLSGIEELFHIHMGIVSMRKFDWCYIEGECTGAHRMLFTFGGGKKMLFTDGDKQSTLTLPHGSVVSLSNDGEQLVKKLPPPYVIQDPSTAAANATPKSDPNEGCDSFFLMLDVSAREDALAAYLEDTE